jgi:Meckel syndrome type 1 protein
VRGAPETVANLSAQIVKKLGEKSTQFDVQLDPAGLGRVNVRIEIGDGGQMSAALSFDNPQAAADLKSRAAELQRALAQSGFDMGSGALSFDVAGDPGGRQQQPPFQNDNGAPAFRGRAFAQALAGADAPPPDPFTARRGAASGVDVRI